MSLGRRGRSAWYQELPPGPVTSPSRSNTCWDPCSFLRRNVAMAGAWVCGRVLAVTAGAVTVPISVRAGQVGRNAGPGGVRRWTETPAGTVYLVDRVVARPAFATLAACAPEGPPGGDALAPPQAAPRAAAQTRAMLRAPRPIGSSCFLLSRKLAGEGRLRALRLRPPCHA